MCIIGEAAKYNSAKLASILMEIEEDPGVMNEYNEYVMANMTVTDGATAQETNEMEGK